MMRCVRWPASCGARCSASRNSLQGCALHPMGSAGRWPATSTATSTATATATATAGFLWDGGGGPVAGDAASPPPGPGPAAGGCAFGRLRSSASQAKRPHPCKLGRRIHAAHAPATGPTPPSTDLRMLLAGVDLGRPVDPRHRGCFSRYSISNGDSSTHGVDLLVTGKTVGGGAVSDCGVSAAWMRLPSLQGRTCGVPAIRHRTALPQNAAVALAVAVEVAGQRPALPGATGLGPAATANGRRPPRVARPALRPPPPGHGRHAPPRR